MLKALEIAGFKSFADKTLFEFPAGITIVVGPNGSGKSNIVDAVKWVLGEQSVKSLRGKEMADVIFNGSSTRKANNSAEITVTFDNRNRLLPIDTPTVHLTRRVYRSGEGEYLINRQPSRLRDIRSLLSGTGMGTQAYSVIEQGKVDALLQSSPRDRRMIFEEAAGISLFKAKKLEALRRLERVEQNLLRLADIVDEVESRLRGVRMQAGKARRYKQYADRLQELRTQVGLADWQRLTEEIERFEIELTSVAEQRDGVLAESEVIEADLLRLDTRMSEVNESIRASEARMAANRERIAGNETTLAHERRRAEDLQQEIIQHRRRLVRMNAMAGDLKQQLSETADAAQAAEEHRGLIARSLVEQERRLSELLDQLERVRVEHKRRGAEHLEHMRAAAELGNRIGGLESRSATALDTGEKIRRQLADLDAACGSVDAELVELRGHESKLAEESQRRKAALQEARNDLQQCRRNRDVAERRSDELQRHRIEIEQRVAVLEELQRRLEGLGSGVKQVLALSRRMDQQQNEAPTQQTNSSGSPYAGFPRICGLVADLFQVSIESAPLVEVALGEAAQHVVVPSRRELVDYLTNHGSRFDGRVGFICQDGPDWCGAFSYENADISPEAPSGGLQNPPTATQDIDLNGRAGVIGRADSFVQTKPQYAALAKRLLARSWFVEKLADAVEFSRRAGCGCRFVTAAGELVEADGSITVGPRQAAAGRISRHSELRALSRQSDGIAARCQEAQAEAESWAGRVEKCENRVRQQEKNHLQAIETLSEARNRLTAAEQRRDQSLAQRNERREELAAAENEHAQAAQNLTEAQTAAAEAKSRLDALQMELQNLATRGEELESLRQQQLRETTDTKVELAKSQERLCNLQTRMRQFEESRHERQRGLRENQEQLLRCRRLFEQTQHNILKAESEIALLYLNKEKLAAKTVELIQHRDEIGMERKALSSQTQQIRASVRGLEEKIHDLQLSMGDVRHRRDSLSDRLREDYGIELAELELEPSEEEQRHREEVQEEIDELRRKINNLGNVNIEALAELEELESRYNTLCSQHKDLSHAKSELLRIIEKINTDSRRLFAETLDTVRGHFQTLFSDLFGGGQADIVLEEEVDILESGIEIVARPPGKEPRSISLLSGGEKTLTCVALLLAIFRSRPSPFCVLDEVDAALDEANIDRFIKVLRGFLDWTQFIIVTHSKKTMTAASTIYGVTMQESGVSKQVSVRFEDVSEDGHIHQDALSRDQDDLERDEQNLVAKQQGSQSAQTIVAENAESSASHQQDDDSQAA